MIKIKKTRKFDEQWDRFLMEDKEEKELAENEYYASMLSIDYKKIYEARMNNNKEFQEKMKGIFKIGNILHEVVQKEIFDGAEIEKRVEMIVDNIYNLKVRGRADVVGKDYIVEIKTISSNFNIPEERHLAQLHFYMKAFNINKGYLFYIRKTDLNLDVIEVEFDEKYWNDIVKAIVKEYEYRVLKSEDNDLRKLLKGGGKE